MSPASNSKSKDKKAAKGPVSATFGNFSNGYNPVLGTFHTLDSIPASSPNPLHVNGRFSKIDDTEDHNVNSWGAGIEDDTVSNNGSWSGESDDHKDIKEKASPPSRQESVPGADNDKREKIRLKNEKKHQRQKERRAQELHERCNGYLMSRKLEVLAQQLVAMGFSPERATMALIMNEGKVEESVAWLFEGTEEDKHMEHNISSGGNLKIDISEELLKITDLEIRYKVAKQEVQRAVVACEGDIEKAEEMLKVSNTAALPKSEEAGDPTVADSKPMRVQSKNAPSASVQHKADGNDVNYIITMGSSVGSGSKGGTQAFRKPPPNMDLAKLHQNTVSTDRTWPTSGSNSSVHYSVASSLQTSPAPSKMEAHHLTLGDDMKNLKLGSIREHVIVMQRPPKHAPGLSFGSSPPGTTMNWQHLSTTNLTKSSELVSPSGVPAILRNPHPSYSQHHFQRQQHFSNNGMWRWDGALASATLSPPSSLGLFSRLGTNSTMGSSSPVDWNTGSSMSQFDYSNIDWSLDLKLLTSRSNGLCAGQRKHEAEPFCYGLGLNSATRTVPIMPLASTDPIPGSMEQRASPFDDNSLGFSRQFVCFPSL